MKWEAVSIVSVAKCEAFRFAHHFIDRDLPGGSWGQTALVDVDRDGDQHVVGGLELQLSGVARRVVLVKCS